MTFKIIAAHKNDNSINPLFPFSPSSESQHGIRQLIEVAKRTLSSQPGGLIDSYKKPSKALHPKTVEYLSKLAMHQQAPGLMLSNLPNCPYGFQFAFEFGTQLWHITQTPTYRDQYGMDGVSPEHHHEELHLVLIKANSDGQPNPAIASSFFI